MENEALNVVYVTDDNYCIPTIVSIVSVISNKQPQTLLNIHVIIDNISKINERALLSIATDTVSIRLIQANKSLFASIGQSSIPKTLHVSRAALFKFLLPKLIESDRVLYIDGDTIIKKDLSELYNTNIEQMYAAVVKDMKPMVSYQPSQVEKLGIHHSAYFNTGMMLLNLEQMRLDDITNSLINYRENGLNFFMDQDAFNVVFSEKVQYVDFKYNMIYSNYEYYSFEELKQYYNFTDESETQLLAETTILHLSSKEKPWLYYDMPFTSEWDSYYNQSPFKDVKLSRKSILNNKTSIQELQSELQKYKTLYETVNNSFSFKIGRFFTYIPRHIIAKKKAWKNTKPIYRYGLNKDDRSTKIIVSLTSYPARIRIVPKVIESLLNQTVKPDAIVLYLSQEQFPNKKLPHTISRSKKYGVTIKFVNDDLKPHKKYFYAMQEYPNDIIITVDDDVYYVPKLIERLVKSYKSHPDCVSASRVHKIKYDLNGNILPYKEWIKEYDSRIGISSMSLIATGVGGVLYPPHILPENTFNADIIKQTCLMADDLWLKIMEVSVGVKVVLASNDHSLQIINNSQDEALWKENVDNDFNDVQLNNILNSLPNKDIILKTIRLDTSAELFSCDYYNMPFKCPFLSLNLFDFNTYLRYLARTISSITICFAVQDTASTFWDKVNYPNGIRLTKPEYRHSYSCIIDLNNRVFKEKTNPKVSTIKYSNNNNEVTVHSYGYGDGNKSYFEINKNNKKYIYLLDSKNNRGLQVLIISNNSFNVLDFFSVDLHKDSKLLINRPLL